jgi:hypothetical protein
MISKHVLTCTRTSGGLGCLLGMAIAAPGLSVPPE